MARLCVSQLGWHKPDNPAVLGLLLAEHVRAIEVTPSKIFGGWDRATPEAAAEFARSMRDYGLAIPAFQAIYFGVSGLHVFDGAAAQQALYDHTARVAELAAAMAARVLVFGAPRLRDPGDRTPEQAMDAAIPVFSRLAAIASDHGAVIGIEANPALYGCRFLTQTDQAAALVRLVNHPGLRLHLDAGGMGLENEDIAAIVAAHADLICHVHASEPHLASFDHPGPWHEKLAMALATIGYQGDISIEMLAKEGDNEAEMLAIACRAVRENYKVLWS
jgi:sugar phosphate isomerase/epimerase